jgi:hypothetical protein
MLLRTTRGQALLSGRYFSLDAASVFLRLASREWLPSVGGRWLLSPRNQPFK